MLSESPDTPSPALPPKDKNRENRERDRDRDKDDDDGTLVVRRVSNFYGKTDDLQWICYFPW